MDVPVPVLIVVGVAFLTLIAIIIAPSRRVRSERKLSSEAETRVLAGESPDDIEAALEPPPAESEAEPMPPKAS
jgi:hypothetical protein